jgi:hypothetical protein
VLKKAGTVCAALVGSLVAASGVAAAPERPVPVAGTANCQGHLIAISNHASGSRGASENSAASAGPGYFLGSSTHEAMVEYIDSYCG